MKNTKTPKNNLASILEVLSLAASILVLAAITQHVNHLNQLSQHLIETYVTRTSAGGFTIHSDFQLVPLVPIAGLLCAAALAVRKRLTTIMIIALTVLLCAGCVWLFGFRLR